MIVSFFFNDTATTEIYTLSLHDALPISGRRRFFEVSSRVVLAGAAQGLSEHFRRRPVRCYGMRLGAMAVDRKSTRLNSSHANISYAVFCLKKKNNLAFLRAHLLSLYRIS